MSDWISVEDELPEHGLIVILKGANYRTTVDGVTVGRRISKYSNGKPHPKPFWQNGLYGSTWLHDVTHWMPLPEPPK